MIELRDVTLAFGERRLIEHATTRFERGRVTALLGRNGTGKSTLLRAIASLGALESGEIFIAGSSLTTIGARDLARHLAYVNTERVDVDTLSAHDLVAIGRSPYTDWLGRLTAEDENVVCDAMRVAGVEHLAARAVSTLSDGECQRVMIARALAQDTEVLLLDEPTSFLDLPNRYELCRLLGELAHRDNKCIIFSTHELDIALSLADSVALVDTPNLIHLPTQQMIASGNIERLFDSDFVRFDAKIGAIRLK